jgi:hypothetical protein
MPREGGSRPLTHGVIDGKRTNTASSAARRVPSLGETRAAHMAGRAVHTPGLKRVRFEVLAPSFIALSAFLWLAKSKGLRPFPRAAAYALKS